MFDVRIKKMSIAKKNLDKVEKVGCISCFLLPRDFNFKVTFQDETETVSACLFLTHILVVQIFISI